MKRTSYIFLAFILCLGLVSCSADSTVEPALTGTETVSQSTSEAFEAETKSTVTEKNKNFSQKSVTKTAEKRTNNRSTTKAAEKTAENTSKSTAKSTTETTAKAENPREADTSSTVSDSISCSISIECGSILENMEDLKAGHESFIPPNGLIMSRTAVTVKSGSSAYDALKLACDKQGVIVNFSNSGYGKYIVGFNNIDEKDCGSQSGWTYKVNSKSIWQSCDKYIVQDGDFIEFSFVCKY